jgi:hypothetical protein
MECRDAQFYLRFRHPGSDELGPEAADLVRHLAECPHCGPAARAEAAFDRAVGATMTAVAVPIGLRNRLVAHVAARRGAIHRRKAYRYAGLAAAAVLLVGIGIGGLNRRVEPDVSSLLVSADQAQNAEESVRTWLKDNNLPPQLPEEFDYNLHINHAVERVQDRDVPVIVFRDRNGPGFAKVYIFRDSARFDTEELRKQNGERRPSSQCMATVIAPADTRGVVYVVVHTGPTLDPFLKPRGQPA